MSSARENARQLLDGVVFSHTEPATEVAAVAQAEATLAVADEIRALRGEIEKLTNPAILVDGAALSGGESDDA